METDPIAKRRTRRGDSLASDCPLTTALRVIGGKWSLIVLYWLDEGRKRFNELQSVMPSISHKVLAATLRDLEREGLITRTVYPEIPPKVEYALSSYGRSVGPLVEAVRTWGRHHLERQKAAQAPAAEQQG